jgi:16S rRNA (adenine1518-N6/adenine1519-N6)-dimethyltransferase
MVPQDKILNKPKKSLGQNYLKDENICRNIVRSFNIKSDDFIIEIGSGQGAITKYILSHTENLIAVEYDINNCNILREKFPELEIINEDILTLSLADIVRKKDLAQKLRIIGNIPYNITSPLLFKLIENRHLISDSQLMIQEEVAQRLVAKPNTKDYGILSVFSQVYSKPKLLFKVSRNCFYPKPRVDSRIIKFQFTDELINQIIDESFFRNFVRGSFGTRRKTLRNSLKNIFIYVNKMKIKFDFDRRAESLSVKEFIKLSNKIYSALHPQSNSSYTQFE